MKKTYILPVALVASALIGCVEDYECNLAVEKPESVAKAELLASFDVLNSYVDRSQSPDFVLGVAVSSADYCNKGLTYSIAKTNFDAVLDPSALAYSNIVGADGTVTVTSFTDMVIADAPNVLAGPMIAHNQVNRAQLDEIIAANFVKGDLESGKLSIADFDNQAVGTEYTMTNGSAACVVEDPAGEGGNVLRVGAPDNLARNSFAQIPVTLPEGLKLGDCLTVSYDLYCVDDKSYKRPLVLILNGARKNFTSDTPERIGCPLGQWARRLIEFNVSDVTALTDADREQNQFTLCVGPNANNSYYYIDNIAMTWQTGEPDKYVEKTPEEKSQALADNFTAWANSLMEAVAPSTTDYIVLADAISDNGFDLLRTAEGEAADGVDVSSMFFFNDYMGESYLPSVTKSLAAAYSANGGNGTPKFYVAESGLLGNAGKISRLQKQLTAWNAAGAKVDGLAISLPLAYSADPTEQAANEAAVVELFQALANTGKLIRLTDVKMTNTNAAYYEYVVKQYCLNIPAAQRAGIIFAGTGEIWKDATRTDVYEAIINGLKK